MQKQSSWVGVSLSLSCLIALTVGAFGVSSLLSEASASSFVPIPPNTLERVSSFEYGAEGLLVKEVIEPDRPNDCLTTTYQHDARGNRISTSDAACAGASGHAISSAQAARSTTANYPAQTSVIDGVTYNTPAGVFAASATNALGHVESRRHDPRYGGVLQLTGPNGGVTTWAYDGFGRKIRENRADGTYTLWNYTLCQPVGQPRDVLCAASVGGHPLVWYVSESSHDTGGALLAPVTHQFHDTLDRAVRTQTLDFHGQVVVEDTLYNALGQVSQKSVPYRLAGGLPHWSTFTYDAMGRVIAQSSPDGNGGTATTQFAYNGLVTIITNSQGQTKTTHKNASGQTVKEVDHLGGEVLYKYDALGQLLQTKAAGGVTQMSYNRRGQKQRMQDPAMGIWDYAYNAFGELVWQQDSLSQTSTMAYDALGRMTQRTEPDLVSNWYHDKKADGTACGAGIGKLCEATSNNGYRRVHAYDAIGRPTSTATVMDSAMNPATVSHTYHPQTGRVTSQTWPTGYRATYTYNALGFLSKVEGGGVTGHAQKVSLEVLAMDPQGRVTQYRQGNNVTTVKAHNQATGRLNSVQATLQGQGAGNVLSHSYTYDKLGNLLTRTDVGSGVTEGFQYDALNRLSLYTLTGGGLSGVQSVQALYDALGNLKYKSDVGYYHYDPQRSGRLAQVTLAAESGWSAIGAVTRPNTGTRTLSYAYDEGRPGTRTMDTPAGSYAMGNGNLWYTVSQDQVSGRHTVRWETYTSFNAPKEIMLGNLAPAQSSTPATPSGHVCPLGYAVRGTVCYKIDPLAIAAKPNYTCPQGFTLSGSTCTRNNSVPATPNYSCDTGVYTGSTRVSGTLDAADDRCKFPAPTCEVNSRSPAIKLCDIAITAKVSAVTRVIVAPVTLTSTGLCTMYPATPGCFLLQYQKMLKSYSCPAGTTLSGANCLSTTTQAAAIASYTCPVGTSLSGTSCWPDSLPATVLYTCPVGTNVSGNTCVNPTPNVAERTLSFVYGPEHQRIRQTVALTSNAPSHMEAGTTWYLNGTDSQGLTYEKEVKANGTIEHKHYVSAGGMSFALYVKREGNLNGKPATSISYFHHDHLGSIAAISNELGQVTERLAYDPWGRRRNVNGQTDVNDALYGVNTDRGYTMHEHLDEMGIVHMNGRLYDPLIGRFMSADPLLQDPSDLQSFNRYAYVRNNPLAYTDPSGHIWQVLVAIIVGAEVAKQLGILDKETTRFIQGMAAGALVAGAVQPYALLNGYSATAANIMAGAAGGFASGAVSGGSLKAGVTGAFSGAMFGAAGMVGGAESPGRYLAHAGAGCISAVASGAKCGSGMVSAVFGKFTTNQIAGWGGSGIHGVIGRGVATAVAGGIGSVIAGGKFANGARTAAYGYLFNCGMHTDCRDRLVKQSEPDRHLDEFQNWVCNTSESGCTVERAQAALALNSAPCLANVGGGSCSETPVQSGSKQFAVPVGVVTTYARPDGSIMNVTGSAHVLNGVVIRDVVLRNDSIYIYTSSTGKGGLFVNYQNAANIGWRLNARAIRNSVVEDSPRR